MQVVEDDQSGAVAEDGGQEQPHPREDLPLLLVVGHGEHRRRAGQAEERADQDGHLVLHAQVPRPAEQVDGVLRGPVEDLIEQVEEGPVGAIRLAPHTDVQGPDPAGELAD